MEYPHYKDVKDSAANRFYGAIIPISVYKFIVIDGYRIKFYTDKGIFEGGHANYRKEGLISFTSDFLNVQLEKFAESIRSKSLLDSKNWGKEFEIIDCPVCMDKMSFRDIERLQDWYCSDDCCFIAATEVCV